MSGEFVTIARVPKNTKKGILPDGKEYLGWGNNVGGGYLNHFLFGGAPAEGKRSIKVRTRVRLKRLPNGSEFVYLRHEVADDDTVVTHEMKIYGKSVDVPESFEKKFERFDCVGKPEGVVVFIER